MKYDRFADLVDGHGIGYRDVKLVSTTFGSVDLVFCAPLRQWHLHVGPLIACFDEVRPSVHGFAYLYLRCNHSGTLDLKDLKEVV